MTTSATGPIRSSMTGWLPIGDRPTRLRFESIPNEVYVEVTCTTCETVYSLDDARVPRRRLRVRCPSCGHGLRVDGTVRRTHREPPAPDDRGGWAHRLARALISDILVYHRDRRDAALADGRLLVEFADEIGAAWTSYKSQLDDDGLAYASQFRDAINEILAGGETVLDPPGVSHD
jgi:predicted Zn finger-like uncharacterized protein